MVQKAIIQMVLFSVSALFLLAGERGVHRDNLAFRPARADSKLLQSGPLVVPDPFFRRDLLYQFDLDDNQIIDEQEICGIKELYVSNDQIQDLTGLERMVKLERLSLEVPNLKRLPNMARLEALFSLRIKGTPLTQLSWLARLTNLAELALVELPISNLPILDFPQLRRLELTNLAVKTIRLGFLPELTRLILLDLSLDRLPEFSNMPMLEQLTIVSVQLAEQGQDVAETSGPAGLNQLQNLAEMVLINVNLRSLPDLDQLPGLRYLTLNETGLLQLPRLPLSLVQLRLDSNHSLELEDLNYLSNLVGLYIDGQSGGQVPLSPSLSYLSLTNSDFDLFPIQEMPNLKALYLYASTVADMRDLTGLSSLTDLSIMSGRVALDQLPPDLINMEVYSTQLLSLPQLKDSRIQNLKIVDCNLTEFTDLPPGLVDLDLSYNRLRSLPPLTPLTDLMVLVLSHNSLGQLPDLPQSLTHLDVSYNGLREIAFSFGAPQLTQFFADNNLLRQLPDLSNNLLLQDLSCSNNLLESLPDLSGLVKLVNLNVFGNRLTSIVDVASNPDLFFFDTSLNPIDDPCPMVAYTRSLKEWVIGNYPPIDYFRWQTYSQADCSAPVDLPEIHWVTDIGVEEQPGGYRISWANGTINDEEVGTYLVRLLRNQEIQESVITGNQVLIEMAGDESLTVEILLIANDQIYDGLKLFLVSPID